MRRATHWIGLATVLAACSQGNHPSDALIDHVGDASSEGAVDGMQNADGMDLIGIDGTMDVIGTDVTHDSGPPGCRSIGTVCATAMDCCSGTCTGGICEMPACTSDGAACSGSAACCSGNCTGGVCVPLNPGCHTLGNACTDSGQCCSSRCAHGVCSASSYCGQNGDVCSIGSDCCGGVCNVAAGARFGTCSQPSTGASNCSIVDGTVCGSLMTADGGGVPACGGACCSRLCAPYGPTGVPICQPASGCHVTGDLCMHDSDCCGSIGGGVTCQIVAPNSVGVCSLPTGCQPDGNVCRTATTSCNARCDCCSGNCHGNTCNVDILGIPRCTGATCVNPGGTCTTSASCCNGHPCVPGPGGTFVCYDMVCVPVVGPCTTNADCCPGGVCMFAPGSTRGTCTAPPMPDAGMTTDAATDGTTEAGPPPTCAMYGQLCTTAADCCNGLPCTAGFSGGSRCEPPPG